MKSNLLTLLKFLIGWPLSLVALIFLFNIALPKLSLVQESIRHINYILVIPGMLCLFFYFLLRSFIWKEILSIYGHTIPLKKSTYLWASSELKRYVPGNIWSFLSRTVLYSKENVPHKTTVNAMVQEVQLILFSTLIVSLLAVPYIARVYFAGYNFFAPLIFLFILVLVFCFLYSKYIPTKYPVITKILSFFVVSNPKKTAVLLLQYVAAFLLFGLGNYLLAAAIFIVTPVLFLPLMGIFVLSLLAGYASLITPMGLGVREGVLSFFLSKILFLESAFFCSLFLRVCLIISELLFFAFSYAWYKTRNSVVVKVQNFIATHPYSIVLCICIASFIFYFSATSLLRYDNFFTGRFDLGNMDQTVWNTSKGRIFQMTDADGTQATSRLAFHADFILVLLAPFYFLWSDPRVLLLMQSCILGLGAVFVFLIGKRVLKNNAVAFVIALLYLMNPSVAYTNLYDFHAVVLSTTFLLAAFYYMISKKIVWFLVFALLAAITKEQIWVIIALFGIYWAIFLKKRVFGTLLFFSGIAIFYLLVSVVIPHFRGADHFALSYYSDLGSSPLGIIENLLFNPQKTIPVFFAEGTRYYVLQLFQSFGFLPFAAPHMLIFALPDFFINVFSNNAGLKQIYYQYTAAITPFLFIATIYGVKNVQKLLSRLHCSPSIIHNSLILYLVFFGLYSAYQFGPLPGAKSPNLSMFVKSEKNAQTIQYVLDNLRKRYSIAATNNLGSHLSHRQDIYTIPIGVDKADIVAFLLDDPFAQPSPIAQRQMVETLKSDPRYTIYFEKDNFIVFLRSDRKVTPANKNKI